MFRELYEFRELFAFLVWRDVKAMYKQAALGMAWALIQPLTAVLVFTIFLGRLSAVDGQLSAPYPLFVYAGLLPWLYFSKSVLNGSNSLLANSQLVTKVYFPREIIPAVPVLSTLVDFGLSFLAFLGLFAYYRVVPGPGVLLMPALVAGIALLSLGLNLLLGAMNAQFRDIRHVLPFVMQIWIFATPVVYPASFVSERFKIVLAMNPMTGYIQGFRSAMLGDAWDLEALAVSAGLTLVALVVGFAYFRHVESTLADVI